MTFIDIIYRVRDVMDTIVPFLISLGVIIFVWGVVQYVIADEEEAKKKGKDRMIYGVIGFTIITSLWGLIAIVTNTFGLDRALPVSVVPQSFISAETCREPAQSIGDLLCKVGEIMDSIIPLLVGLGVIVFVSGVVQYVIANEEEAKTKGRDRMIYGIIGLVVIASVWGLVSIVVQTFSLDQGSQVAQQFIEQTGTLGGGGICDPIPANPKLHNIINYGTCLITKSIIPLILALAVLLFIWGIVQYVISAGNEEQKEKAKQFMIWGIIALTVMVSVWGIVRILGTTIGIEYAIPQVK